MKSDNQFKVVRGKGSYGCDKNLSILQDIIKSSNIGHTIRQLRILHCPRLASIEGIELCKQLVALNISCNGVKSLLPLGPLIFLQTLDVKANCLKNLNGIQNLLHLTKLDASQNALESCEGLGEVHKRLQILLLFGNRLSDLRELQRLKSMANLREISFAKGGLLRSNPLCQDKGEYYKTLRAVLSNSKNTLAKIDELSQEQVQQFFQINFEQSCSKQQSRPNASHNSISNNNIGEGLMDFQKRKSHLPKQVRMLSNDFSNQRMLLMTQRQADLEHIIQLKQDNLEELKHKYSQLQITSANQFRESIKKEAEYERVTGQIAEMANNIDRKDQKINDLHRRIEELLKVNATANSLADSRASELEKIRKEFTQLRIENSELKVLSKDQENRLRELQNKTLSNIEDKSQRIEQLRTRNEQILRQNYDLQKQQQEYKDRVRQLTQLLKQWQTKYEHTLKQLQNYHQSDKQQLAHEYESRIVELKHKYEQSHKHSNQQWQQKLNVLQKQYSITLENAIEKYSKLRKLFDQKSQSQAQIKVVLKTAMNKNKQYQSALKQYEQTLIKSKKAIITLTNQNEAIRKEYYDSRGKMQTQLRHFQNELSKIAYGKQRAQKQLKQLKVSNDYLQKSLQNLNTRQKQFQQLLQKSEALQIALDAKNVMLDDKNDRIQSLKVQLESLQKDQQQRVDIAEMEKLSQKYRRQKQLLKSLEAKCLNLTQQNQALVERCQTHNLLEEEVGQVREIISKQSAELQQKQQTLAKYYETIEKLKAFSENLLAENGIVKGENNRLLSSLNQKQVRFKQAIKERQSDWQRKVVASEEQMKKYKSIAQKFLSFSKTVNI